jgi:N-acetylglucosaminyldiphosphoundecaprenol N-acetyl-beta-D-mannosaminyltransferase
MRVDCVEPARACQAIVAWAVDAGRQVPRAGRYVCAANVHMTMEAHDDPAFREVVNGADLVLADGQPMVWALRALGLPARRRVRVTPDLLLELFATCESQGVRVGLYGGTTETAAAFMGLLAKHYPRLEVPYAWAPPFRPLTADEDRIVSEAIAAARVQLLLVGIGCPKQERWMAAHAPADGSDGLVCVQIGVGAAFDMLGGRTKNAPAWMRDRGLEWAYRLASEPRRLWRRQLKHNPRFVCLFAADLVARRIRRHRSGGASDSPGD